MGAVCEKNTTVTEVKPRKAAVEVSDSPPNPNAPPIPEIPASAVCPPTHPASSVEAAVDKAKDFVTGEGDGVYLMLVVENGITSLVQQYAHEKPITAAEGSLLLQVKPPVYIQIKESRFVLQNGRRTLRTGIPAAMSTPEGQVRVCEAVLECVRLVCCYSAYLHAYSALTSAPFSILLLVSERHSPANITEGQGGHRCVKGSPADIHEGLRAVEGQQPATATATAAAAAAATAAATADIKVAEVVVKQQGGAEIAVFKVDEKKTEEAIAGKGSNKPIIFKEAPELQSVAVPESEALEWVHVLRYLVEGWTPTFNIIRYIIIIPLTRLKAEEVFNEGRIVTDSGVERLQKEVEKLSKLLKL